MGNNNNARGDDEMHATTTTTTTTLRQALKVIRADLQGQSYLSGPRYYSCDRGTLLVRHDAAVGGCLLGVFVVDLLDQSGLPVRTYPA